MIVHQVFAIVHEEIVQNIIVCDNYELANQIARGTYGESAVAVDCLQYPCMIGGTYKDGKFYGLDGNEIAYVPTQEQQVQTLQQVNELLYKTAKLSAQNFTDEQAVKVPELYPVWTEGTEYQEGDRVTNEYGELYKAVVTHVASSLDKEEIGEETAVTKLDEEETEETSENTESESETNSETNDDETSDSVTDTSSESDESDTLSSLKSTVKFKLQSVASAVSSTNLASETTSDSVSETTKVSKWIKLS